MELVVFMIVVVLGLLASAVGLIACIDGERLAKRCERLEKNNREQREAIDVLQKRWMYEDLIEEKGG